MKRTILGILEKVEEGFASFFFLVGTLVCLIGVFYRYILNNPISWTSEIFELFMVFAIFIGFGMALKDDRHITVDLLYDKLPPVGKRLLDIISSILGSVFSIFLTVMGIQMVSTSMEQKAVTINAGIPEWWTLSILPIGMGLLSIYFLIRTYKSFTNKKATTEVSKPDMSQNF